MAADIDAFSHDALALPPDQRLVLAERLLLSIESDFDPGADDAWDAELMRRITRFDAGESETLPATDVFARLSKIAPGKGVGGWSFYRRPSSFVP